MQTTNTCEYLSSAIALRRKYFIKNLKKTIKSPTCENTHRLSTSLKRLLIVNDTIKQLYGKKLIPTNLMIKINKFRKVLTAIRDNHELRIKLETLKVKNSFLNYIIELLDKRQIKLEKNIIKNCRELSKFNFDKCFKKKSCAKILKKAPTLSVKDLLQELLTKTGALHKQAIINSDDKALHKMRIKYKSFRYSYELLAPSIADISKETHDYLRTIQTALGEAHDWLVMKETIQEISERSDTNGKQRLLGVISHHLRQSNSYARDYIQQEWPRLNELSQLNQPESRSLP